MKVFGGAKRALAALALLPFTATAVAISVPVTARAEEPPAANTPVLSAPWTAVDPDVAIGRPLDRPFRENDPAAMPIRSRQRTAPVLTQLPASLEPLVETDCPPSNGAPITTAQPAADALAPTVDAPHTADIQAFAASLGNDPMRIFTEVRNTFEFEPYYFGSVKGARETLEQRAGSDIDLASLLLASLRVSGVPAYYMRGNVLIPGADAASWVGVSDPRTAANILATAGYQVSYIALNASTNFVQVVHTWVEACFLYNDVMVRAQFDPSFKKHVLLPGRNIAQEAGLDGQDWMETLLDASSSDPNAATRSINDVPLELVDQLQADRRAQMIAYLEANHPTLTAEQIVGRKTIVTEQVLAPPLTTPVLRASVPQRSSELTAALRQHIRFQVAGLDTTLSLPQLAGRRVTLNFVPATAADEATITANGGILKTVPRSVNLRPRLSIDGVQVALGAPAALGDFYGFALDFHEGLAFTDRVLHTITIGGVYAVALDTQRVTATSVDASNNRLKAAIAAGENALDEDVVGELLHSLGRLYFGYQDKLFEYGAGTQGAVLFHQVNEALVSQDLYATRAGTPSKMFLSSKTIDAPRTIVSAFKSNGAAMDLLPLLYTAGVGSSSFEEGIFRLGIGWPAISTTQFFQEAAENEVPIYGIGPENVNTILPQLQISNSIKNNIAQMVAAGYRALVPQRQLRILDWQGLGWVVYDPDNGTGGFMISGGLAGGSGLLSYEGATPEEMQDGLLEEADFWDGFWNGLIKGDFDNTTYRTPAGIAGKILGQIVSGVLIYGDIRDGAAAIGTIIDSRGSDGWLDLGLSLIGLVPVVGDVIKGAKYGDEAIQLAKALLGNGDAGLTVLRGVTSKEIADGIVANLGKSADTIGNVSSSVIRGSDAAVTAVARNGTQGTHVVLADGDTFVRNLNLDPTDGSILNRGRIGETAARDLLTNRGWTPLYTKPNPTTPGLDGVFRDPSGNIVIVEAKFVEGGHNVGASRLSTTANGGQTELTNDWIFGPTQGTGAIDRSLQNGVITPQVYAEIEQAFLNGTLRKELVVVSNRHAGRTITDTLSRHPELGGSNGITFTIVEMNQVVPKP